jgi:hypothetical protein
MHSQSHHRCFQQSLGSASQATDKKLEGFSTAKTRELKTRTNKSGDPNTLIEDEYIHNLQQQIYFLELESKLLKEKERERGGFLLDAEAGPLSENLYSLRGKYRTMEQELQAKITEYANDNRELYTKYQSL